MLSGDEYTAYKKVTWAAVENAGSYKVTVKLGKEVKIDTVEVTATEYDLSQLTDAGEYDVTVAAVPTNKVKYINSKGTTVKYTVAAASTSGGEKKKGCKSSVGFAFGAAAACLLAAAAVVLIKRRRAVNK